MDMQQLRTFVDVVRQGSFAAAARQQYIDPSIVSRTVASIERQLGVRLMQRTTRKLSLTEAGTAFYEHVCTALQNLERANDEARSSNGEVAGLVRITSAIAFGQAVFVPSLPSLHERYPRLQVELILTDRVLDLVAERVDLALRFGPPLSDSTLVAQRALPTCYRVCASPGYVARHGRPRDPSDLARLDCPRIPLPGHRTQWRFRGPDGAAQSVDVRGWLIVSTAQALHQAALEGLGPTLLADWMAHADLDAGRLVDLFPQHEVSATDFDSAVWLVYPSRLLLPRRVRAVVAFLKDRIEPLRLAMPRVASAAPA